MAGTKPNIKLVTVGDHAAGKTCLLIAYTTNKYPSIYVPTIFDYYRQPVMVGGLSVNVDLFDTRGHFTDDYERLRPLTYIHPMTDVFLACFSIENRESLENVTLKWIPEVRRFCPNKPIVLVACQIDLREKCSDFVTYEEGSKFASDLGLPYIETSALTQEGLKDGFDTAIRVGLRSASKKTETVQIGSCCRKKHIPFPPLIPPFVKVPVIEVETSRLAEDWMAMHENPVHADVTFVLSGQHKLDAHKIVLCSASKYFRQIFGMASYQMKTPGISGNLAEEDHNLEPVEGVVAVYDQEQCTEDSLSQGRGHTVVELRDDIKPRTFFRVLQFLYSGEPKLTKDQDAIDQNELADVMRVSEIFKIPELTECCQNCLSEEDFLNPSIGTLFNNETKQMMRELYFNNPEMADVAFNVEGRKIYAHKCVLSARCETMAAMFRGHFVEGQTALSEVNIPDTSAECFLALLEYLYTDHSPIEEIDVMDLLVLADKYGQKRLMNLCELYISKEIDKNVTKNIAKAEIDVIGLLHTSQDYNANQLSKWCLHFISTNYASFQKRKEFSSLMGENKTYIEENQWPPVSYLHEVEDYEQKWNSKGDTCSII